MTASEFLSFWPTVAAETPLVSHLFKWKFPERWLRIHSLPESKRYAETAAEWQILLQRQQTVLHDLLRGEAQLLLITGYYTLDEPNLDPGDGLQQLLQKEHWFNGLDFKPLPAVDLYSLSPDIYGCGTQYWPLLTTLPLHAPQLEPILRAIADEASIAFFIGQQSRVVVAPYDGGMDILLPNTKVRSYYREQYRAWLSTRDNGF